MVPRLFREIVYIIRNIINVNDIINVTVETQHKKLQKTYYKESKCAQRIGKKLFL